MSFTSQSRGHRRCSAITAGVAAVLGVVCGSPAFAQQADAHFAGASEEQLRSWHESLKLYAPVEDGCFHTSYPSVQWERQACGPKTPFRSAIRPGVQPSHATRAMVEQIAGNGNDYVAQTTGTTLSAAGSFPTATGISSEKGVGVTSYGGGGLLGKDEYTLQLNTNISSSASACGNFGYSSCEVWAQFVYSTAGTYAGQKYPSQVFIQNWVFPSQADYSRTGCPSGWQDAYADAGGCLMNSNETNTPNVAATSLGNLKLSGAVSAGRNTAIFTNGTEAYSSSQADTTVYLGSWWKQSEFNVVGNGGGSRAKFNPGVSLSVSLAVQDGTTGAPQCISNAGTTGESNNLTLGPCHSTGGASPSISFSEDTKAARQLPNQ